MQEIKIFKLTENEFKAKKIENWPIWEKEVSRFEWYYDSIEECYIIEGEFVVETKDKNYKITAEDFVVFPKGLACVWDIKKPVRKYYNFP